MKKLLTALFLISTVLTSMAFAAETCCPSSACCAPQHDCCK